MSALRLRQRVVRGDDEGEVFLVYKPYINGVKALLRKEGKSYPRRRGSGSSILSPSNFHPPPVLPGDDGIMKIRRKNENTQAYCEV